MAVRAKKTSPAEAFITFLNDEMLERRTSFPAEIKKVNIDPSDGALVSVDVQPLTQQTISSENSDELSYRNLPVISGVPVVFPHCTVTGFSLTIPIAIGCQVLVVIADRSIDNWQSSGTASAPAETVTPRAHDLTDAIAIIGISCDVRNVKNYRLDRMEMRNSDGTTYVALSNDEIEIETGDSVIKVAEDEIELTTGSSSIKMTSDGVEITGDTVTINGNILELASTTINVTASDLVSAAGISLTNHTHTSGGSGNPTSPPL